MLTQYLNDKGIVFTVNIDGHNILFKEWSATDDGIYYFPLATLVDNGDASFYMHECTVPFESLYLLDNQERILLGVPNTYDKALRLRGEGMLNTPYFRYKLELLTHVPDGKLISYEKEGNIVVTDGKQYLLDEYQYELFNQVEAFNAQSEAEKTTNNNLRHFANIKALALKAGCELDSYLANENVYIPKKIKLEVGKDDEGFTVKPSVDIPEADKFTSTFEKMRRVQELYPVQNDKGERRRILLSAEQQECLKPLKERKCHFKNQEEVRSLIDSPTEFFDPDQFDLSEFYSDRVIEIGLYRPKFYPFVCPYESCWIAGATVGTRQGGTSRVQVENEADLSELKTLIDEAETSGSPTVIYHDAEIAIADAQYLVEIAEKQLKNPQNPIEQKDDKEQRVLIIEENAEELGFEAKEKFIETSNHYTLFTDSFLDPKFALKAHQQEGVAWLQYLYKNKASGCLMADDMGLGKTLQILYFIDWHSRTYPNHNPYLIVAPISLLENWENEYRRFFTEPRMNISRLTSKDIPRKFDKNAIDRMQKCDIILTNYDSLRISQLNFCAVEFDAVALDEAQKIKSPGTLVTNAAKALKANFKIAMTGTPVENTLIDLWCIMDFCVPGLLGNAKSFAAKYQNPLKNADTDIVALGNEIHEKLGVHFMRRLKADAAKDLPKKIEIKEEYDMPQVQKTKYISVINDYNDGLLPNMLTAIMNMKLVSEHPYLYNDTLEDYTTSDLIKAAARLNATIDFMDKIKTKGEKVIVFTDRKDSQKMLQRVIFEKYGIPAKIINGDTPSIVVRNKQGKQSRQSAIDEFQNEDGFNVIIMSPIAAGMGLNVTAANHVIHYSRHWNPAKESQATDRAYRIGQTKDVYVYYPIAVSKDFKSFDKILDELLSRKNALATSTIFPSERIEVKQDELGHILFGSNAS